MPMYDGLTDWQTETEGDSSLSVSALTTTR